MIFFEAPSGPPSPVTSGLLMYMDAGNSSSYPGAGTTWTCLQGSGEATLLGTGAPVYSSADGGYIDFNNERYANSTSQFTGLNALTIFTFIKIPTTASNYDPIIFSRSATSITGLNFGFNTRLAIHHNGTIKTSNITPPLNEWIMVAVSISSSSAIFYQGRSTGITSNSVSGTYTTCAMDNIGICIDRNITFRNGNLDMSVAMIYNRALSAAEITENFDIFKGRYGY
jgi:hypothetical protein